MNISNNDWEKVCEQREIFANTLENSPLKISLLKGKGWYSAEPMPEIASQALMYVKQYIDRAPHGPLRLAVRDLGEKGKETFGAFLRWGVYPSHDLTEEVRGILAIHFPNLFDTLAKIPVVEIPEEARELPLNDEKMRLPKECNETFEEINFCNVLDESFIEISNTSLFLSDLSFEDDILLEKVKESASSEELRKSISAGGEVSHQVIHYAESILGFEGVRIRRVLQDYTDIPLVGNLPRGKTSQKTKNIKLKYKKLAHKYENKESRTAFFLFLVAKEDPSLLPPLKQSCDPLKTSLQMFFLIQELMLKQVPHMLSQSFDHLIDHFGLRFIDAVINEQTVLHWAISNPNVPDEAIYYFCRVAAKRGILGILSSAIFDGYNAYSLAMKQERPYVALYVSSTNGNELLWGK